MLDHSRQEVWFYAVFNMLLVQCICHTNTPKSSPPITVCRFLIFSRPLLCKDLNNNKWLNMKLREHTELSVLRKVVRKAKLSHFSQLLPSPEQVQQRKEEYLGRGPRYKKDWVCTSWLGRLFQPSPGTCVHAKQTSATARTEKVLLQTTSKGMLPSFCLSSIQT